MAGNRDPNEAAMDPTDLDAKLDLISKSYSEVLDATKHQDDKVGRMLTSVAFLTAATLALAALGSASFVTRRFEVPPFVLPLGLITLAAFLVGVVFTVMLLLTSLATPLRLPGLAKSKRRPKMDWVRDVTCSQVYFYEISGVAADEWVNKWGASVEELKKERLESLILETHNLADRTNTKYDRTTEAAALLSFSLLAFALAIIFVTIAADNSPSRQPIHLDTLSRVIIGGIIGGYCGLQLLARIRHNWQSIDETEPDDDNSHVKYRLWGNRSFALLLPAVLIDVVIGGSRSFLPLLIFLTILLGLANIVSFWFATDPDKNFATDPDKNAATLISNESAESISNETNNRRDEKRRLHLRRGIMAAVTIALIVLATVSGANGWYAGQLGAVSLAVLSLITVSVLGPTFTMANRRRRLEHRREENRRREASATAPPENLA